MIKPKDFFSKLRIGWLFVFTSFELWCDHMTNKSKFDFWTDGFYNFDNGPEKMELIWSNYEIAIQNHVSEKAVEQVVSRIAHSFNLTPDHSHNMRVLLTLAFLTGIKEANN